MTSWSPLARRFAHRRLETPVAIGAGTGEAGGMDHDARPAPARPVALAAVASSAFGLLALVAFPVPLLSAAAGLVAVLLARSSRERLRAEPSLRGVRASLLGFVLGTAALVVGAAQVLAPYVLMTLFFL
ncbi:hypothetical protein [Rathayibacter sp. VKM Ac-2630]|uniref:hypothetical protein n=1 Tax=Rathayibacter sp. VKM Ac-2630 TaxID=1938617 RepID=UPI000981FA2E|nr:hypothetical protein [Rathayibacter sp. VKM Ac-2630]OOB91110.1 hypothetical protein B0T42_08070 [Rathayibacter sp. VKM Ac-2630]